MMKKLCLLACLGTAAFNNAHAQAISAVKFSVDNPMTGQAVEVWPAFSGPVVGRGGECAVTINFGDGGTQQIKIDPAKPPVKAGHIYTTAGNYVVTIEGRTIYRGFNSTSACDGNALSAALTVRDAKVVEQEAAKKAAAERSANVDPTARLMVMAQVAAQAAAAAQKSGQTSGLDAQAQAQTTRDFDAGLGKLSAGQLFGLADQLNAQNLPEYARMALRKLVIQYSDHPLAATAAKMLADSAAATRAPAPAAAAAPAATPSAPAKPSDAEAKVIQQQEEEMKRLAEQRAQNEKAATSKPAQSEKPASSPAAKTSKKLTPAECTTTVTKLETEIDGIEKAAPWKKGNTKDNALEAQYRLYAMTEALQIMEKGCPKVGQLNKIEDVREMRAGALAMCRDARAKDCSGKKPQ